MPRLSGLSVLGAFFMAAACSGSPTAAARANDSLAVAAASTASPWIATSAHPADPATSAPVAPPKGPAPAVQAQSDIAPESHLLDDAPAEAASAVDPLPAQAGTASAGSGLPVGRTRRPLVHPASDAPRIVPIGSEIPEGPVAAADAPVEACAIARPTACNLDYKPVCAEVDTGVRKTYSSACKACRDPAVGHYVSGTCPKI